MKNKLHHVCLPYNAFQQTKNERNRNFECDHEFSILLDISGHLLLIQTIGKTNLNKAPGLDKIPIKLIKLAGDAIYDSLLHIFNLVLSTGIFPDDLKLAKIIPIHKEGDKAECGNYRPISVIPIVAKILEKIIYDQLSSYINDNDIICKQQFGFRPNHSTETALLKCRSMAT